MARRKYPRDTLTSTEAAAARALVEKHGAKQAAKLLGICDEQTLYKAIAELPVHRLTAWSMRTALAVRRRRPEPAPVPKPARKAPNRTKRKPPTPGAAPRVDAAPQAVAPRPAASVASGEPCKHGFLKNRCLAPACEHGKLSASHSASPKRWRRPSRRADSQARAAKIRELAAEGLSRAALAERFGLSRAALTHVLARGRAA